jgi:hypothetical protein
MDSQPRDISVFLLVTTCFHANPGKLFPDLAGLPTRDFSKN